MAFLVVGYSTDGAPNLIQLLGYRLQNFWIIEQSLTIQCCLYGQRFNTTSYHKENEGMLDGHSKEIWTKRVPFEQIYLRINNITFIAKFNDMNEIMISQVGKMERQNVKIK
ncbi:unnamed protein product [Paramecium primaurelia]|uniref:Uncharacterized protein n=1 Tax=Paramecium primaurelia TaxID=5886 RepID=A0A8S1JSF4_PARPR|nr:unnamed protein product [Paramecium primaurelia]